MESKFDLKTIQDFGSVDLNPLTRDRPVYYFFKRLLDLTLTISALILLWPVMLLIAGLIWLDSPGPVFFVQERVGARRRAQGGYVAWERVTFPFIKFRTMVHKADPALHEAYVKALIHNDESAMAEIQGEETTVRKLIHDPRVTRVGKFLRKSSLDELPQLWNIFRGEMSLVGPRPAIPYEVEEYQRWHLRRLEAMSGLTGLWQVTARSSANFDEIIRLDIEYIENQSFLLDIKILLKTPFVVLRGKGAT